MKRFIIYAKLNGVKQFESVSSYDKIEDVIKDIKERAGRPDVISYFILDKVKAKILDSGKLEYHLKKK
jgi:hypothetical protein